MQDLPTPAPFYYVVLQKAKPSFFLSSMFKPPVIATKKLQYDELPCSEEDSQKIYELVHIMGTSNIASLSMKENHLKQLGQEIKHVHPLKFLEVILKDEHLRDTCMPSILRGFFTGPNFMGDGSSDGLGTSLSREMQMHRLLCYLDDFAAAVDIPKASFLELVNNQEWEKLVLFLIKQKGIQ